MLGLRCGAGLAPVVEAGGLPPGCGDGLLVAVDPPAAELQGSGAVAPEESSWTGDQTSVPHNGRWILNPWTTRGVLTDS